LTGYCYQ